MERIPDLPPLPAAGNWDADVLTVFTRIQVTLQKADDLLYRQEGQESIRYKVAADKVHSLENAMAGLERSGVGEDWLRIAAGIIDTAESRLRDVALYLAGE